MGTCATGQKPTKSGRRLSSQMSGGDGGGGCPDAGPRVADGADGADGMFESACILMILLPARPSRLNVMSMPRTRRNVCARRRRPASARGFLGQPARSVEMPSLLLWSAPARRRSAALPVHELRSAMISRTQVAIGSASIMHSIAPLGSTQRLASTGSNRLSELSAVAISDLRLGKVSPAAGLRRAPEQPLARRVLPHPPKVELLSERSHPNAAGLDDGEVTSPIV